MDARHLHESFPQTSGLRVDREKGVIYGVRVLGPESKNTYGVAGVEATEYSPGAHADGRRMYEGMTVNLNHIRERGKEHRVQDAFGKLTNATTQLDNGQPVTVADLHYLTSHEMAGRVCEDIEKKIGVFGLSHDAYASKERVDKGRKRLVIEGLRKVNSVDLVLGAATNRNLWESTDTRKTFRAALESLTSLPPGKSAWKKRLLEDGDMAMSLDTAMPETDPDAALAAGFRAAVIAVLDDESLSCDEKKTRIGILLTTQDKLESGVDPSVPEVTPVATETPKVESIDPAEHAALKAKVAAMEADSALTASVRQLCESEKFTPNDVQLTALKSLGDDKARKALIADLKPKIEPRSGYTGGTHKQESTDWKPAVTTDEYVRRLRG